MKRTVVIGLAVLLVAGGAALVAWLAAGEPQPVAEGPEARAEPAFPEVDPYAFFEGEDEPVAEARASAMERPSTPGAVMARPVGPGRRDGWADLTPEERRAKRLRLREEWQQMTPEERAARRAERAERRVQITGTGDEEPALQAEDVMHSMRDVRPQIRDCVRENGGWRALRESVRSGFPDGGAPRGMSLAFDVASDGSVSPDSLSIDPPPPGPFGDCFTSAFQGLELPAPNAEAHVEVSLSGGRRRGR